MSRSLQRGSRKSARLIKPPSDNLLDYAERVSRSVLVRSASRGEVPSEAIEDSLVRQRKRLAEFDGEAVATMLLRNLANHHFHFC